MIEHQKQPLNNSQFQKHLSDQLSQHLNEQIQSISIYRPEQMKEQQIKSSHYSMSYANPFLKMSNQSVDPYENYMTQNYEQEKYSSVYELPKSSRFFQFNMTDVNFKRNQNQSNFQLNELLLVESKMLEKQYEEQKELSFLSLSNNFSNANHKFNSFDTDFNTFKFEGFDISHSLQNYSMDEQKVSRIQQNNSRVVKLKYEKVFNNDQSKQIKIQRQCPSLQSSFMDSFKVQYKKPQLFMGAFSHTQSFFNFSDINVLIPTLQEQPIFSKFLQNSDISIISSKLNQYKQQNIGLSDIKRLQEQKEKNSNLYTLQTVKSEYDEKQIKQKAQQLDIFVQLDLAQSIIQEEDKNQCSSLNLSLLSHYPQLFESYHCINAWQYQTKKYTGNQPKLSSQVSNFDLSQTFQIYHPTSSLIVSQIQYNKNINKDVQYYLEDKKLMKAIGLMIIGIQNPLFKLDYQKKEWYSEIQGISLQHTLRNSLNNHLKQVFDMANYRARLEQALIYIKENYFRRIYFQIGKEITHILHALQQIVLELLSCIESNQTNEKENNQSQPFGILQFLASLKQTHLQIKLVYNLMINQDSIKRQNLSYNDFDYRFLRSQFQIFLIVLRLSKQADGLQQGISSQGADKQISPYNSHIISSLVQATFQPIISILNILLFEQITTISHKDQTYLKYYFESTKQIISNIGKRIKMIKDQSLQLYQICKLKGDMNLVRAREGSSSLIELEKYQWKWNKIFNEKQIKIQNCLSLMKKQYRQKLLQLKNKRMKQIYELKLKLYEKQEQNSKMKKEEYQKNKIEIQKLKIQIKQKQQKKKLQQLIQKQRQKGYLLDLELKEKHHLILEKDKLLDESQSENIKIKSKQLASQKIIEYQSSQIPKQSSQISNKQVVQQKEMEQQQFVEIYQKQQPRKINQRQDKVSEQNIKAPQSFENRQQQLQMTQIKRRRSPSIVGKIFTLKKFHFQNFQNNTGNVSQSILSDSLEELSEQSSSQNQSLQMIQQNQNQCQITAQNYNRLKLATNVNSSTIFQVCIDRVLVHQTQIINNCMCIIVFQKYHMPSIVKFMRKVFMFGNGEQLQQLLNLSVNSSSIMDLKYFSQCFLFDSIQKQIKDLKPEFYHMKEQGIDLIRQKMFKSAVNYYGEIDLINENLENSIGFQFGRLPNILDQFFSYIHLGKYMQIFSFLLRLRHCENLMASSWKMLNSYKKNIFKKEKQNKINSRYDNQSNPVVQFQVQLMKKLFLTRQIIQNFLTVYQNYIYFRVIQKQYKALSKKHKENTFQLAEFPSVHLKLLDTIIRFVFIDNSTNNITKDIRKLFEYVREFYRICERVFVDDIPEYAWEEVQSKVKFIFTAFSKNHKFFQSLYYRN